MVIGVTGRSCSGKDVVVKVLEERGIPSVNVDHLGHIALDQNKDKLVEAFGEGIIMEGKVDRKILGPIVFSDPAKLAVLNGISHPWMVSEVEKFVHSHKLCTINAALLESMDLVRFCNDILYVYAPYELRKTRAMSRDGLTEEAFERRNENQQQIGSTLFECGKRVITIINDKDMAYLYRQINCYCDILIGRGYIDE